MAPQGLQCPRAEHETAGKALTPVVTTVPGNFPVRVLGGHEEVPPCRALSLQC